MQISMNVSSRIFRRVNGSKTTPNNQHLVISPTSYRANGLMTKLSREYDSSSPIRFSEIQR